MVSFLLLESVERIEEFFLIGCQKQLNFLNCNSIIQCFVDIILKLLSIYLTKNKNELM